MPENIDAWWARRQRSKGRAVPYEIGAYRTEWERYPALIRQYHPDLNRNITLTQIPPAAEVYLTWQCDMGHLFVATPDEQRNRPGAVRRRSSWCPDCLALAAPRRVVSRAAAVAEADPVSPAPRATTPWLAPSRHALSTRRSPSGRTPAAAGDAMTPAPAPVPRLDEAAPAPHRDTLTPRPRRDVSTPAGHYDVLAPVPQRDATTPAPVPHRDATTPAPAGPRRDAMPGGRPGRAGSPAVPTTVQTAAGEAFHSGRAPKPASAAEGKLRMLLGERLDLDLRAANAVKVRRPFFAHKEVWPDIVLSDLRVAIEYDTIGKFGLEHVGTREATDRRKDRLLREAGWEVIRVRCGKLQPLGDYDLVAGGVTPALVESIIERLREIRGDLFVNAYLR